MATKWTVKGRYEWTEERHFNCVAYIDTEIEAKDEESAIEAALKQVDGDADETNECYSDQSAWRHGSRKNIKAQLSDTDDDELRRKHDNMRNLELMSEYSTPLFVMPPQSQTARG